MGSNYCKMPRITVAIFAFLLVVVFLQRPSLGDSDSDGGNNEIFVGRTLEGSGGSDAAERINNINIIGKDEKVGVDGIRENRVTVLTVASLTLIMAAATGLGAVPFFFVELEAQWAGICNGIAAGVMLAASFDLVQEGQKYGEGSCVVIGVMAGGIFIFGCQKFLEQYGDVSMLDIKGADARKMVLVVGIMTLHSFGEGSGVGVSFAGDKGLSQGLLVTIAIAVHNIPEGLAVSMVLASRGVPASNAFLWSVITSLPQPLVAVPAFVCAEAFHKFLPFCMGFAAGCMIWMVIAEVLPDGFKEASASQVASAATLSVAFMETLSAVLQSFEQKKSWENTTGLPISLLFGLGPFLGGFVLVSFATAIRMPQSFSTGMASGIAFVLALWRPLQLWWGGKLGFFYTSILLAGGAFLYQIISSFATSRILRSHAGDDIMKSVRSISPTGFKAFLASSAVAIHAFAEGLALGVAAPKAYGMGRHLMLPVSLYGFPRGACVASCIYGATNSWRSALSAATMTGCAGPIAAIAAILSGIDYSGLDKLMVLACGIVLVPFGGPLVKRALKLNGKHASYGVLLGLAFAMVCLTSTKLVCLHTPYCNSAPETVT